MHLLQVLFFSSLAALSALLFTWWALAREHKARLAELSHAMTAKVQERYQAYLELEQRVRHVMERFQEREDALGRNILAQGQQVDALQQALDTLQGVTPSRPAPPASLEASSAPPIGDDQDLEQQLAAWEHRLRDLEQGKQAEIERQSRHIAELTQRVALLDPLPDAAHAQELEVEEVQRARSRAEDELDLARGRVDESIRAQEAAEAARSEAEEQVENLQRRISQLEVFPGQLETTREVLADTQYDLARTQKELRDTRRELERLRSATGEDVAGGGAGSEEVRSQIDELRVHTVELAEARSALARLSNQVERERADAEQTAALLQERVSELQFAAQEAVVGQTLAEQRLEESAERERELQDRITELESSLDQLQAAESDLVGRLEQLESLALAASATRAKVHPAGPSEGVDEAEGEAPGLADRLVELEHELEQARAELEQQRSDSERGGQELTEQRTQMARRVAELTERVAELEPAAAALNAARLELAAVRADLEEEQQEKARYEERLVRQREDFERLSGESSQAYEHAQARARELAEAKQEAARLQEELESTRGSLDETRSALDRARVDHDQRSEAFERRIAELEPLVADLEQAREALSQAEATWQEELAGLEQRVMALQPLREELESAKRDVMSTRAELDEERSQARERMAELERLRSERQELENALGLESERAGDLDHQLEQRVQELAEQRAMVESKACEAQELAGRVDELEERIQSTEASLNAQTRQAVELGQELETANAELERYKGVLAGKLSSFQAASSMLNELKPMIEALETQLEPGEPPAPLPRRPSSGYEAPADSPLPRPAE